jgi:UDP-GlcNAc:undecaprenyl-phosphate GlcNAc-1-phosphate transferase
MLDQIIDFLKALGIYAPGDLGWVTVILAFIVALLVAWWFTPRTRMYSLRVGWADEPNPRRVNKEPLPNAGGLAIFAAVVLALIITTLLRRIVIVDVQVQIFAILLGGSLVIMAGFIDDQYGLPPIFRLLVQLIAALLLVGAGIRFQVAFGGDFATTISIVLTIVWIVAITNAINLIDGLDGLAGGVSFITSISLLAVSAQFEERAAATILLAASAGAALGFLRHNFPPSRIIMGDSGAYFFGFVLAASALLGNLKITTVIGLGPAVLALLLVFLLPVIDTLQVIARRLLRRKNPLSTPGRDHLHHRLLALGYTQRRATLILWGVTLVTNVLAMIFQQMSVLVTATTAVGIVLMLAFVVWRRLRAVRKAAAKAALAAKTESPAKPAE